MMAAPRPRPQVMRLTDAAAERIKAVMARADRPIAAVRVGVKNGGCAGMSYYMEYAEKIDPLDEVIEDKGVRILIDPKAVLFLLGTEMDYKVEKLSAQFVFNNPNQTAACGCGELVQLEPASGRPGSTRRDCASAAGRTYSRSRRWQVWRACGAIGLQRRQLSSAYTLERDDFSSNRHPALA